MTTDMSHSLPLPAYDRDITLNELIAGINLDKLSASLISLLDSPFMLKALNGDTLLGEDISDTCVKLPIRTELEPIGYLEVPEHVAEKAKSAVHMLEIVLVSAGRYLMASDLHLNTVQSDYEALQKKHQALLESESRYKDLAENLELRVQEQVKTIDSAQRQLKKKKKMASIGQLAAGVAHEINNPIGFIRSNLSTAESYVGDFGKLKEKLNDGASIQEIQDYNKEIDLDFVLEDFKTLPPLSEQDDVKICDRKTTTQQVERTR